MKDIMVFKKPEFGEMRTMADENGNALFCAQDVCNVLGYKRPNDAVAAHVEKADTVKCRSRSGGQQRELLYVNESGLYALILSSKLPRAREFKHWVTAEVLPSLRRHGVYLTPEAMRRIIRDPDFVIQLATTLKAEREKVGELTERIVADRPRVVFSRAVERSKTSVLMRDLARVLRQNGVEIGEKRLYEWMREQGYLCSSSSSWNRPTQRSMDKGLFEVRESVIPMPDGTTKLVYTTLVTGKGQVYFVNNLVRLTEGELMEVRLER